MLRFAASTSLVAALACTVSACRSAQCAEGLTLDGRQCVELSCEPCGAHEFCDTSGPPAECRCAPGYAGDPCAFEGLILDPSFRQEVDTGAWVNEDGKGAFVSIDEPGDRDLGEGVLRTSVICSAGNLLQTAQIPSYDVAQPLVVEIDYQAVGVLGLAIGFNRSWTQLPPSATWRPEVFCLGEGGYGVEAGGSAVDVRISASGRLPDCASSEPEVRVGYFNIRPDTEGKCPSPGSVVNGTAEDDGEPWPWLTEGDASAGIEVDAGSRESPGARLFREAGATGRAVISTQISIPLPSSTSMPALTFWWRGTLQQLFEVKLGTLTGLDDRGRQVDTLVGTIDTEVPDNLGVERTYCLPPWTHGSVFDLSFSLPEGQSPENVELVIDGVAIIDDEDCESVQGLLDPGFDARSNRWFGASLGSASERVLMQDDDGNGVLELGYWTSGAKPSMERYVLVPESEGVEGPAVFFYSKSPALPTLDVRALVEGTEETVVETQPSWELNEVCLPWQWAGRWFRFEVRVEPEADPGDSIDTERILLDDFAVGTSPGCAPG